MENRICKDCSEKFILSEKDINFYKGNCLQLPKRCWSCKVKRATANKIDLSNHIGKFIQRTKPEWTGDRSFLSKKIELVRIEADRSIVYRYPKDSSFYKNDELSYLRPESNDGYWKVVD